MVQLKIVDSKFYVYLTTIFFKFFKWKESPVLGIKDKLTLTWDFLSYKKKDQNL